MCFDNPLKRLDMKKVLFIALLIGCAPSLLAQTASLKVKGEATVKAIPELMMINIPLEAKAATYTKTSDNLTKTYNDLESALVKAGIADDKIQSSSLRIQENYRYENRERILDGYVGSIQVYMELDHIPENMEAVISTLKQENFNFGYNLSFGLSESQKKKLLEEALKEAVADGKNKADILAEALEMRILSLDEVNYGYMSGRPDVFEPKMRMDAAEMSDGGDQLNLNPREMEIRKEVGLVWNVAK